MEIGSIGCDAAVDEDTRPHAVAMPFPTQGHINPLMHFCRVLASKGFVITFVNTESNQQSMQKNIVLGEEEEEEEEEDVDFRFETIPDGLPVPTSQFDIFYDDNRVLFRKAMEDLEGPFEKLLRDKIAKRGPPVSCLVTDLFLKWSQDVAERLAVPRVVFWTATAASLLIDYHIPQLLENGDIPVEDPSSDKLVSYIPGLSPLPVGSLPCVFSSKDSAYDPGFLRRIARARPVVDAPWILTNTFEELEREALEASRTVINPNSIAIGPLLPPEFLQETNKIDRRSRAGGAGNPSLWKEDKECLVWLDGQEPESVLFVSFGSIATLTVQQFEELAAGLELLGQPFVWVVRPNSVTGLQPEAFEAFRSRAREGGFGLVVSWAPQLEVLKHAATGGFLTHCGWNSTLESICAGVPLLCWPCVAEQHLNCKLVVHDWKIGLSFSNATSPVLVERHEFAGVVRRLMGHDDAVGAELRKNVRGLRDAARKAVLDGGSSQRNLQKFIDGITGSRKQAPLVS